MSLDPQNVADGQKPRTLLEMDVFLDIGLVMRIYIFEVVVIYLLIFQISFPSNINRFGNQICISQKMHCIPPPPLPFHSCDI